MLERNFLQGKLMECAKNPADAFTAGRKYAQAYASYAKTAQSCMAVPPLAAAIDAAALKLGGLLGQAFATSRDPATTVALMATAFAAFWFLPPIPFPAPQPGAITAAIPATLQTALLNNFIQGPCNAIDAARKMSIALHTWTTTAVIAAHGGPVPCISPLV